MTALAGMCLLMEGSTLRKGKYSDQIRKAVEWFLAAGPAAAERPARQLRTTRPSRSRYMYGHGFGRMFLASVYGEEEDKERRKKLEKAPHEGRRVHRQGPDDKKHRRPKGRKSSRRLGLRLARPTAATSTRAR